MKPSDMDSHLGRLVEAISTDVMGSVEDKLTFGWASVKNEQVLLAS